MPVHSTALKLAAAGYRLPAPAGCPAAVYAVMNSCWATKRADRPNFATLEKQLGSISIDPDQDCACVGHDDGLQDS